MPGTIKYLDLTLPSPEENLALDEALLDACDVGGDEVLRFWESPRPFVVVGFGRKVAEDVDAEACRAEGIPILRRCSGGGTVVQGPGCLNYALVLRLERDPELRTVSGTNHWIMERNRIALTQLTGLDVRVEGHTDLAVAGRKFSGNAQRRKRHALLFHGTLLLDLQVEQVERWLRLPPLQPEYRQSRNHRSFLRKLALPADAVKAAFRKSWHAHEQRDAIPSAGVNALVDSKYSRPEWNRRI
jgi:lipoate-protein ligase A